MRYLISIVSVALIAVVAANTSVAQHYPLPQTTTDTTANEGTAPFLLPQGVSQTLITNRTLLNAKGLPASFGVWDMVALDESSRYIFVPSETSIGAGLFRYDTQNDEIFNLLVGNGSGVRESDPQLWDPNNDDFARLDPATYTPWKTVITAEETTGGRLFEVLNPKTQGTPIVAWRSNIPAVAHEGLRFDAAGTLYFVDENNSGCIYKFVPLNAGDLSIGQTFVMRVDAYNSNPKVDPSKNWNDASNLLATRFGIATWVPITDANGIALTAADPFDFNGTNGGNTAANEVNGTPYGRPEDLEIGHLSNGNEVLYCAVTSENTVLSIELVSSSTCIVRPFVNYDTINEATGLDVNPTQNFPTTSPGPDSATNFDDPDNVAIDAWGNVYIIEDEGPGDIWRATDANGDGVAESIGLFASLGVQGSEPSGFMADPNNPYRFIVAIQHPSSGNDALWSIDTRPYRGTNDDLILESGINTSPGFGPGEAVKPSLALDVINIRVSSPRGTLDYAPIVFFYDLFLTGSAPSSPTGLPFLHVDLATTIVVVDGRVPSIFQPSLPAQGFYLSSQVPFGLAGFSVMMQSAVFSGNTHNGVAAVTDGHEITFVN